MNKRKKHSLILVLIILLIGNVIAYAPDFLLYSTGYQKTDAIVLYLGPDFSARQKEAYKIINEGKTDYLIIPAYHKIYKISDKGTIKSLSNNLSARSSTKIKAILTPSPCFYEDTHTETIEAKKIMADFGLKSAIFISSPYHMRRIKLIVTRVFSGWMGEFYFIPTSFEKAPGYFWKLSWENWKKVGKEYGKMFWFCLYIHWPK